MSKPGVSSVFNLLTRHPPSPPSSSVGLSKVSFEQQKEEEEEEIKEA